MDANSTKPRLCYGSDTDALEESFSTQFDAIPDALLHIVAGKLKTARDLVSLEITCKRCRWAHPIGRSARLTPAATTCPFWLCKQNSAAHMDWLLELNWTELNWVAKPSGGWVWLVFIDFVSLGVLLRTIIYGRKCIVRGLESVRQWSLQVGEIYTGALASIP